jgi:hypothetical protein
MALTTCSSFGIRERTPLLPTSLAHVGQIASVGNLELANPGGRLGDRANTCRARREGLSGHVGAFTLSAERSRQPHERLQPSQRDAGATGSVSIMVLDPALLDWLLDADPALRWQVERDLAGAPQEEWRATRAQIAAEGFAARLLALQDPEGQWAGGAYFPGDFDFQGPEAADGAGQPWTATTWTLNSLRDWGARRRHARWHSRPARRKQSLGVRRPAVLGR